MKRLFSAGVLAGCWLGCAACRVADDAVTGSTSGDQVVAAENTHEADDYVLEGNGGTVITLNGGSISVAGEGVSVEGTTARITRAGTFTVRGSLADGQIKVDAGAAAKVKLVLDGVDITTSDDAPIFVKNAAKAVIYLAPDSSNRLTDGSASTRDGAIHCKTRLSIFGTGTLRITGNVDDAINAEGGIIIEGGNFDVRSLVSGIKSDLNLVVNGGTYSIRAGNDGMHGEKSLTINGGTIDVVSSVEGLEGATVTMNGGTVHVASSDDGVNASSGGGGTAPGAPPGMGGMATGSNPFYMRGGYLYVDANGDGLDVNGPVEMSGGTVVVNGPTANDNGALDYTGSFTMTGGVLIAAGSAGMAQMPSRTSSVNSLMLRFSSVQQANTLLHIANAAGDAVLTFRPTKRYQSLVLASPRLAQASGYTLSLGGVSSGAERDGVFTGGVYSGGTRKASFDVSSVLTSLVVN